MTSFFPDCWLFSLWTNSLWLPKKNQTDFTVAATWSLQKRDTFQLLYPESSFPFLIGSIKATELWLYCACLTEKASGLIKLLERCLTSLTNQNQACNRVVSTKFLQAYAVRSEDSRNKISLFPAPNSSKTPIVSTWKILISTGTIGLVLLFIQNTKVLPILTCFFFSFCKEC